MGDTYGNYGTIYGTVYLPAGVGLGGEQAALLGEHVMRVTRLWILRR